MTRATWHILRDGPVLTLARKLPARFDLSVTAGFPPCARLKLAQQIRQDMWRALQGLRGFAPAVRIEQTDSGLQVEAGGQVDGRIPATASAVLSDLLNDPAHRDRWIAYAGRAAHA